MSIESEIDELYRELILDHYRRPRNTQFIPEAQHNAEGFNPFCGDQVSLQIMVDPNGVIQGIGQQGNGCSISQASASMLTEVLKGKSLEQAKSTNNCFRRLLEGESIGESELDSLGMLEALAGVRKFPVRIKCALLAWTTMEDALGNSK